MRIIALCIETLDYDIFFFFMILDPLFPPKRLDCALKKPKWRHTQLPRVFIDKE